MRNRRQLQPRVTRAARFVTTLLVLSVLATGTYAQGGVDLESLDAYFAQATEKMRTALDMYWRANDELRRFA